ncbi:MAG: hypothetical protein CME70_08935 [Halobacteriovorax sp.]|nr:hypothetical protein [Halobacteriovorax sp.]
MRTKLGLIFFGLFLSFFIIEGGLRLAGSIYVLAHDKSYFYQGLETEPWDRDETFEVYDGNSQNLILAIGDSFTNGGNVQSHQSYPAQLFKIKKESSVVNLGRCESSAYSAYLRLKNYFEKNTELPKFVTILVGAADGFVEKPESEDADSFMTISQNSWLYELRVYKLLRYINLGLKKNRLVGNLGKAWDIDKEISETIKVKKIMQSAFFEKKNLEVEWKKAHEKLSLNFLNYCERNKIYVDNPRGLMHASLVYLVKMYASKGKHGEAFSLLFEFQNDLPDLFWSDFFQPARFFFYQIFQIQSKTSSVKVFRSLEKQLTQFPELEKNINFDQMLKRFKSWEEQEKSISEERRNYLTKMVDLVNKSGARPILMTYPSKYQSANSDLRFVANSKKVQLVDLNNYFSNLSEKQGRSTFFEDDDHLTPYGYQLMADRVAKTLEKLE